MALTPIHPARQPASSALGTARRTAASTWAAVAAAGAFWAGTAAAQIQAPALKWQTPTQANPYYSSPAVADLDGDGQNEVIAADFGLQVLEGATGAVRHFVAPTSRVWPGVAVADIDDDGDLEIVRANRDGELSVYDHELQHVWTQQPSTEELRSLALADLDADQTLELVVGIGDGISASTWVYEHDGSVRGGWPQLVGGAGYSFGVYGDATAVGDIDGDSLPEVVVAPDTGFLGAYESNGAEIAADALYGSKPWGGVRLMEGLTQEIRGFLFCSGPREEANAIFGFARGGASVADVDGDGALEVLAVGLMVDTCIVPPTPLYDAPFLFNGDRTRFQSASHDWTSIPVDTGPLLPAGASIESVSSVPVPADLDGDGELEFLFAGADGRLHAFWLDGTEHGAWPFAVYDALEGTQRHASEPVVADLDADGQAEVIFTSWVEMGTAFAGYLYLVDSQGALLHRLALPAPAAGEGGAVAAPTLGNLDADPDLELVISTTHAGVVAYDLPGSASARVHWATGRGSPLRRGQALAICGDGLWDVTESCDDGNLVDLDGCSAICEVDFPIQSAATLFGTATGGSIELVVSGVSIVLMTTAGQSAAALLDQLVAAIHADPTLSSMGILAGASAGRLSTNGAISLLEILDAGLFTLDAIETSSDATLLLAGAPLRDEDVVVDDFAGAITTRSPSGWVEALDLVAYDLATTGSQLLSVGQAAVLSGGPVSSRDVLELRNGTYSVVFEGAQHGIPAGTRIDAVATRGNDLLLSFDRTVALGSLEVRDEDLVRWDGAQFSLFFDGSAETVDGALDLDAAHRLPNGVLLLSFDRGGEVASIPFQDDDVLIFDPSTATWELAYDASEIHEAWSRVDLDAVSLRDSDGDGLSDPGELLLGTDPNDPDSDADGLSDGVETLLGVFEDATDTGTDPTEPDTDGDGVADGIEVAAASDPLDPLSTPVKVPALGGPARGLLLALLTLAAIASSRPWKEE